MFREPICREFISSIESHTELSEVRKRLEKAAEKDYHERLKVIAQMYDDAVAIRLGIEQPEGTAPHEVALAFMEAAKAAKGAKKK